MADTHAKHGPSYMAIFWYLAVLTVVEIGVIYLPISKVAIGVLLVILASTKAAMVALYFMHLRLETRTLGYIALTPVADRRAAGDGAAARLALLAAPDGRLEEGRGAEALTRGRGPGLTGQ